jgi:hypothetical protein
LHEWRDGGFNLFTLAGGIKHRQMERNPRVSIIVSENGGIGRSIEVRGIARFNHDGVKDICLRIAQRYFKHTALFSQELERLSFSQELETVRMVHVRIEPGKLRIWDSADGIPGWRTEIESAGQRRLSP